ncbi:integrase catalytic domain-containing protein [Nephila pilipes]|uniref:Integrase catalytic domain-containing protein n=1 Tax=Nephila pilipes TaxID=299642 RepID=A0A8X6U454_NEPPI|nr:integrase catalytic domain-containing protein [Nephila pilipes]
MELFAAVIGARVANSVVEALQSKTVEKYFWIDSIIESSVDIKRRKLINTFAWILRIKHNCLYPRDRKLGELTAAEFHKMQIRIIVMIQEEYFTSESDNQLKTLQLFKDKQELIRMKTKIVFRKDNKDFLTSAVLPTTPEVVKRLHGYTHEKNCHEGSR